MDDILELIDDPSDITKIGLKLGVDGLFMYENEDKEEDEDNDTEPKEKTDRSNSQPSETIPNQEKESQQKKGSNISKVSKEYLDEMISAKAWNEKSKLEVKSTIEKLIEIIGDIDIGNLSFELARKYKKTLVKLPTNMKKVPKKAHEERKPFSEADIKKIFKGKIYLPEATPGPARYWIPLLGLFTGARLNELCQLHVGDVIKEDGIWCLDI